MRHLPLAASLAVMTLGIGVSACASKARDPFDRTDVRRGQRYTVFFEVSCNSCRIEWSVAQYQGRAEANALWTHREHVWVTGDVPEMATLNVSRAPGAKPVAMARISVNGKVAAEAEPSPAPEVERHQEPSRVTIRTPVPPPVGGSIVAGDGSGNEGEGT